MPTPISPKKANGREQNVYWIRKKVPARYRALVGRTEVWVMFRRGFTARPMAS